VLSAGLAAEAVAVGVPDAELGEAIVLFAVFEAGDSDPEESVRRAITADLPAYMVPRRVIAREALPRNANGKVDRAGLKREARELGGA
jgi:acyl-CoA synthetase (AMP-forming)/AMP-acid ligase II